MIAKTTLRNKTDTASYPIPPVRRHGMQHHIPCSLSHGIRYHIILHAACKAGAGVCAAAAVAAELLGVSLELLGTSLELLGVSFELLGAFIGLLEAAFELLGPPPLNYLGQRLNYVRLLENSWVDC